MAPEPEKDNPGTTPPHRSGSVPEGDDPDFWDLAEDGSDSREEPSPGPVPSDSGAATAPDRADPTLPSAERRHFLSPVEWISLGALMLIIFGLAIGALVVFNREVPREKPADGITFPIKGERLEIAAIETFWRTPSRSEASSPRGKAEVIPCAIIKLKSGQGRSALRVFFQDDDGHYVGDSDTLVVSDGRFDESGSAEIEIQATDGFEDEGAHTAYVADNTETWHFVVKEGPNANARGDQFKQIVRMPISVQRR